MKLETYSTGFYIPPAADGHGTVSRELQGRRERVIAALPPCDLDCGEKAKQVTYLHDAEAREVVGSMNTCRECAMRFSGRIKSILAGRSGMLPERAEPECAEAA